MATSIKRTGSISDSGTDFLVYGQAGAVPDDLRAGVFASDRRRAHRAGERNSTGGRKMMTTLNAIREHGPCEDGWRKLLHHLAKEKA